jgi:dihydrofolate synthase/folylpolyglutamate synthase
MRFEDALAELDSRQPQRMIPDLSRITRLAELLGDPQLTYPSIHVTGTNGKTTTSRFIATLACEHGIPSGLYTSPHLESVTERLSDCGTPIPEAEFAEQYERLLPYLQVVDAEGEKVTYFEVLTALAYTWFSDKPVSLGVFEVGMGGEWDATNLVSGDVAVITPIALDHPELGPTLADKAREKSAIVKPGKVGVVRRQPDEVMPIIEERARDVEARLLIEGIDFGVDDRLPAVGGQLLNLRGAYGVYPEVVLPLFGEHTAMAAAAGVAAVEAFLDRELDHEAVQAALSQATAPGRLEIVARHPLVILDGAHNPAGMGALVEALEDSFQWDNVLAVIAISADKDVEGMMELLASLSPAVYAAEYVGGRALPVGELAQACRDSGLDAEAFVDLPAALTAAAAAASDEDLILVTGSLFTVGEARSILSGGRG